MKGYLAFLYALFLHSLFVPTLAGSRLGHSNPHGRSPRHLDHIVGRRELLSTPQNETSSVANVTTPVSLSVSATPSTSVSSALPSTTAAVNGTTASQAISDAQTSTLSSVSPSSAQPTSTQSATPSATPSQSAVDPVFATIYARRLDTIIGALTSPASIPAWLSTLGSDGKWPDSEVDYTTGCDAQRANWPAQTHWLRIVIMAGAWHGGLAGDDQFVKDANLRSSISLAMNYWFSRDFTNPSCLESGGSAACPCSNPDNTLWNTNWFSNVILIPKIVTQTCLILNGTLAQSELNNCVRIANRSYIEFDHPVPGTNIILTGANALDVARVGMDQAILTGDSALMAEAYGRVHEQLVIQNATSGDGIRADGAFGQHNGILYNGNYGKDFTNSLLGMEIEAAGTQFAANAVQQSAFGTLFNGDTWMIFRNAATQVLHWDFSVLGRFIAFPVIDPQATGSINLNLTEIGVLGQQWSSKPLTNFANSLSTNGTTANAGNLQGNKMFYTNDYMVQRGRNYVSTLKMWSVRSRDSECTNLANPEGFHLTDGATYTYLNGGEYEDIAAAWDWNLIPGITVDYNATPLVCANTNLLAKESFVGGASDGKLGVAAMRYTNPVTGSLKFQKAWFFLANDVQHVMVANITSTTQAPVYSVLDQRRHSGTILVDGSSVQTSNHTNVDSLWHGNVGYTFSDKVSLSVQVGEKTGAWTAIGTSTQPPTTVDLFAAWIVHKSLNQPISYSVFPGTDADSFRHKSSSLRLRDLHNDASVSAVSDDSNGTIMVVFWQSTGGAVAITPSKLFAQISITANHNCAIIYKINSGDITVSDPSQSLTSLTVTLSLGIGRRPTVWGSGLSKSLTFALPQGGLAGSSVTKNIL